MTQNIQIDKEFQALIPPLSAEEKQQLEANIVADGCRDPLVVWGNTLIDGHNRYEICTRLGLPFDTVEKEFESRDEVADWMDANALGRRNLHPNNFTLILGRRYNRTKKAVGSVNQHTVARDQNDPQQKTADKLAAEYNVSPATVKRAGQYADALSGGVAELNTAVTTGAVSVAAAADVATLPKAEQVEIVARGTREILQAAKEIRAAKSEEKRRIKW